MDQLIGKTFGPYTIVEKIGEGGMAVVYKGYQESLNRYVAIKILRGELADDPDFITRFQREALAVAKLSHPNILHVYDAGLAQGVYYIAMDYVDGGSLKDLIAGGPLQIEHAISIATQVADALDYAHRQGLVHRDVKPANILLTREGRPLLTDFGIARALGEGTRLTRTGTSIGTPAYMAPEQAQGQPADGRTDLYALGIVLYEMLTGWVPFSAHTPVATLYKQVNDPLPPLRQANVNVPTWLEAVVSKALAKDPRDRYQRTGEFAEALRRHRAPSKVARPRRRETPSPRARPTVPAIERRPAERKRRQGPVPILLGAIVVLLLAVIAGGAYLLLGDGLSPRPTPTAVIIVASPAPTDTPLPTPESSPTPLPTDTPPPTVGPGTPTPVILVITATSEPTAELTATSPPTTPPAASSTSPPPSPAPTRTSAPPREPGVITDFETFGTWKRGDEPNGTFTQSSAQVHQGSYAGKLAYDFGTSGNDYVVFEQTYAIDDQPTRITGWVYGDGSGHFLNAWIKDKAGQIWQVPLGRVTHTGWQQMVGLLDVNQPWPWTHISGPDNGKIDYPVSFYGLVLDDGSDSFTGSGTIYIDDLRADTGAAPAEGGEGGATPTVPAAGQPTSPPVTAVTGRIAFSAGGTLHIVKASTGQDTVAPVPNMRQPDFRADGAQIIANGEGGGRDSLWNIDANTGAFLHEQSPFTDDFHPFWSPDGSRFVYDSLHHGLGNFHMLYTQGLGGRKPEPEVTLHCQGQQIRGESPVWMHDDWVAFTGCDYWPGGTGGSKCGLYRMPSWSGQPALIKSGSLNMRATDNYGGQLLFMSQDSGNWEVYIIPNQGGTERNLSNSPGSQDGLGTFSPDGKLVAFVSNRGGSWAIWVVKPDGSGLSKLFDLPAPLTAPWTDERISWGP